MIPRDEADKAFPRDLRSILRAAEVGLRWADNIGPMASLRYLASRAPIQVATSAMPHAVLCLRAVNRSTRAVESGCRVTWTTSRMGVQIESLDVSDTAAEYDVTLGLLLG